MCDITKITQMIFKSSQEAFVEVFIITISRSLGNGIFVEANIIIGIRININSSELWFNYFVESNQKVINILNVTTFVCLTNAYLR